MNCQLKPTTVSSSATRKSPPLPEEPPHLTVGPPREPGEHCPCPGEEEEGRSAEVRHPAGEEERNGGGKQVLGGVLTIGHEIADVIERHQDHRQAPDHVDRLQPGRGRRWAWSLVDSGERLHHLRAQRLADQGLLPVDG